MIGPQELSRLLGERAAREEVSLADARRQHCFEGVLRRVAALGREDLVLRGGVLLRAWVGPERPAEDLDFLATWPFEAERARSVLAKVCAHPLEDGLRLGLAQTQVTWTNTPFPGLRAQIEGRCLGEPLEFQIDLGCGDPMAPGPAWVQLPGVGPGYGPRVLSCQAETLFGWKLHGLYERGLGTWRAKDLHDLFLLLTRCELEREALIAAIRLAHESRAGDLRLLEWLRDGHFGQSRRSRRKWRKLREGRPPGSVPEQATGPVALLAPLLKELWPDLIRGLLAVEPS